jgi:hypothetical protein
VGDGRVANPLGRGRIGGMGVAETVFNELALSSTPVVEHARWPLEGDGAAGRESAAGERRLIPVEEEGGWEWLEEKGVRSLFWLGLAW